MFTLPLVLRRNEYHFDLVPCVDGGTGPIPDDGWLKPGSKDGYVSLSREVSCELDGYDPSLRDESKGQFVSLLSAPCSRRSSIRDSGVGRDDLRSLVLISPDVRPSRVDPSLSSVELEMSVD